ncbi:cytochrome P450 [Agrocybe pediades]|nr:cytochrome P450 [Agrocybe pediades]
MIAPLTLFISLSVLLYIARGCWIILKRVLFKSTLHNVPGPPSKSFIQGVLPEVFNERAWDVHQQISKTYGGIIKLKAPLGEEQLYVFDPKAMHHILLQDAHMFTESPFLIEGTKLLFGPGLLGTYGEQHRRQRRLINPLFSNANMREMGYAKGKCIAKYGVFLIADDLPLGLGTIDMLSWASRTALELIGQCGIGYSFDPLTEDEPNHPYILAAKALVPAANKVLLPAQFFLATIVKIDAPRLKRWLIDHLPWKALKDLQNIVDTFHETSLDILRMHTGHDMKTSDKKKLAGFVGDGKDILSHILRTNEEAGKDERLTEAELLGEMSALTFAATDTTSSSIARTLFLLATHRDIQDKLRQEMAESKGSLPEGEELAYDEILALPYLDAVCRETLRLYSPPSGVMRMSREETILPLSTPIKGVDGSELTEVVVPKNTNIYISILSHNRNPDLWGPDAHEYIPERWLKAVPDKVAEAQVPGVYSHMMTFSGGGRGCIGFRFAILEMKVILSMLIENFRFSLSKKDIEWRMTHAVATATVVGNDIPQLPLIVERV